MIEKNKKWEYKALQRPIPICLTEKPESVGSFKWKTIYERKLLHFKNNEEIKSNLLLSLPECIVKNRKEIKEKQISKNILNLLCIDEIMNYDIINDWYVYYIQGIKNDEDRYNKTISDLCVVICGHVNNDVVTNDFKQSYPCKDF
eukprot:278505_1